MMYSWAEYSFLGISIILFTCLVKSFRITTKAALVLDSSLKAFQVIRSKEFSSLEKERNMQILAMDMFKIFCFLCLRTTLAIFLSSSVVFIGIYAGLYDYTELLEALSNVYFIAASILLLVVAYRLFP